MFVILAAANFREGPTGRSPALWAVSVGGVHPIILHINVQLSVANLVANHISQSSKQLPCELSRDGLLAAIDV